MVETVEEFYSRTYWVCGDWKTKGRVFVYATKWQKDKEKMHKEIWTLETAKNYLSWLEQNQPLRVEL